MKSNCLVRTAFQACDLPCSRRGAFPRFSLLAFFAVLLACASRLAAQSPPVINHEPHHDSTIPGNLQRTYGRMLEGVGRGARNYAEALNTLQSVRRTAQQLHEEELLQWHARRALAAERAAEAAKAQRPSREQLQKWAQQAAPKQLSTEQLSSAGRIQWDPLLLDESFAIRRGELEQFFAARAQCDGNGIQPHQAHLACAKLLDDLRQHIATLPPMDFLRAKKFILSLQHEAHLETASPHVRVAGRE